MRLVEGQVVTDRFYPARGLGTVVTTYPVQDDQALWVVWDNYDDDSLTLTTIFASNVEIAQ